MQDRRSPADWTLLLFLSLIWASAYAFTRLAVSTDDPARGLPANLIIPVRLCIGSVLLLILVRASGQTWPPRKNWKDWAAIAVMGTVGTAAPFLLITHAQKTIDSSLAALYVAAAPLFVAVFAHLAFRDDKLSTNKILGLIIGFGGVLVLFGPSALEALSSASTMAQALCLIATVFYAISTITARYARNIQPFAFAAGFVTIGAIATLPLLLFVNYDTLQPSSSAIIGLIGLGLFPTALASVVYTILIQRTRATFLALTGYTIPILSVIIGFLAFGETQSWNAVLAFVLILGGVWLSQRPATPEPNPAE